MLIRLGTVVGGRSSARVLTAVDATRHLPNCVCADLSEAGAEGVARKESSPHILALSVIRS